MRAAVKLDTRQATYERLFEIAHRRGKKVTIAKAELMDLLIDHARMIRELGPDAKLAE